MHGLGKLLFSCHNTFYNTIVVVKFERAVLSHIL